MEIVNFGSLWKRQDGSLSGQLQVPVDMTLKSGVKYQIFLNSYEKPDNPAAPDFKIVLKEEYKKQ